MRKTGIVGVIALGMVLFFFSLAFAASVGADTGASTGPLDDSGQPQVFVKPLTGDPSQIMGWQPALGEGLAEMLITELSNTGKFQMIESTAVNDLVDEIRLGEAGYSNEKERVDKGGFAGADYMFVGKVTRFGSKSEGVDLGGFVPFSGGNLGVRDTSSDVRIDWRFTDAYTRKIIKTGSSRGSHGGPSFNIGVAVSGHGGNIGYSNQEFMNSALGKATVKAIKKIVEDVTMLDLPVSGRRQVKAKQAGQAVAAQQAVAEAAKKVPGKVLAVPAKGTVIISLGEKNGLKVGDKVKLYETIDTKDEKGVVVFTEEKLVGEVTVQSVQEDRSKASYDGAADVKSGWSVKNQ